MEAITAVRSRIAEAPQTIPSLREPVGSIDATGAAYPDPLDEDGDTDEIVVTTRRAIGRVALVATETGARFQRESVKYDALAWMFTPREVFGGFAAVDACLSREECMRGILLHGLGLGMDADRRGMDALLATDDEDFDEHEYRYLYGARPSRRARGGTGKYGRTARMKMYTATIVDTRDNRMTQVFHASLARDATEVRTRLAGRFGPDVAELADIRQGVHVTSPPVMALVPGPVLELVRRMERDAALPSARTFSVDIEMGIQA